MVVIRTASSGNSESLCLSKRTKGKREGNGSSSGSLRPRQAPTERLSTVDTRNSENGDPLPVESPAEQTPGCESCRPSASKRGNETLVPLRWRNHSPNSEFLAFRTKVRNCPVWPRGRLCRGKTVTKPLALRELGKASSEKQIPQVVENLESGCNQKEALETNTLRVKQAL